jgi:DNA polymerase III delta subunit
MAYLFLGEDFASKEAHLKKLKEGCLKPGSRDFNFEALYARELQLKTLQERFLSFPVNSAKRLIVIKEAERLKPECREFILRYLNKPYLYLELVLDAGHADAKDDFFSRLARKAKTIRFKEELKPDAFLMSRCIFSNKPGQALKVLNQLLQSGEKPERIIGGIRYALEKEAVDSYSLRKRLKVLLAADMQIKTGKLKPQFALERLVISLSNIS